MLAITCITLSVH